MSFITGFCMIRQKRITTGLRNEPLACDAVEELLETFYNKLGLVYPKFYKMDNQARFGFLACEVLLRDCPIERYESDSVAVILTNSNASLDTDIKFEESTRSIPSPSLFVYTLSNIVTGEICIRHSIKGENAFFVTPAFDPLLLTHYVEEVFSQVHVSACIAGWVDVVKNQYDVFLYLVEKEKRGLALDHTSLVLENLYINK